MIEGLAEFLLARIAEDEAWLVGHGHFTEAPEWVPPFWKRVEAECESKRRILEQHCGAIDTGLDTAVGRIWVCAGCGQTYPCLTMRYLALPYAGHPDYREEWKP